MNLLTRPQRFYREFQSEEVKRGSKGESEHQKNYVVSLFPKRRELYEIYQCVWVHLEGAPAMLLSSTRRQKLSCSWERLSRFFRVKSLKSLYTNFLQLLLIP